ncbi:MAG: ribosome biogenesis GTPase Der [Phycisphaeraceae bacterium]|nr:ribosome biogenesis GTPase Der [Phycisphaeraceae bacterium]
MLPKLVIVGRPNVGKSSLLNLLAQRRISIVAPKAGVTRDRVGIDIELPPIKKGGKPIHAELIDTGGYGVAEADDLDTRQLTAAVEQQIEHGLAEADVVLFVVDAQAGVLPLDEQIGRLLRKAQVSADPDEAIPILLIANKVDSAAQEPAAWEAASLGFGEPVLVSTTSKLNQHGLRERLAELASEVEVGPGPSEPAETGPKLAIVGKRNAGKSTLVNALAGGDRVIVSEMEGTTRDSVDVRFDHDGKRFTAIDTAGVRRKKSLQDDIEYYSYHRSLRSVRRADVCLLLVDATVPISQVDRKLAAEITRHHKPTVVVINKWDLVEADHEPEEFAEYLTDQLKGLDFAPVAFISAAHRDGLSELIEIALELHQQAGERITTGKLNRFLEEVIQDHSPASKSGKRLKIYYTTQLAVYPPTIGLFVNDPDLLDNAYRRYLINRFREALPFPEVPIQLIVRGRSAAPKGEES